MNPAPAIISIGRESTNFRRSAPYKNPSYIIPMQARCLLHTQPASYVPTHHTQQTDFHTGTFILFHILSSVCIQTMCFGSDPPYLSSPKNLTVLINPIFYTEYHI